MTSSTVSFYALETTQKNTKSERIVNPAKFFKKRRGKVLQVHVKGDQRRVASNTFIYTYHYGIYSSYGVHTAENDDADRASLARNASCPFKSSYAGMVRMLDEELVPIEANDHVSIPEGTGFGWESI